MKVFMYRVGKFNDVMERIQVRGFTPERIIRINDKGETTGTHRWNTAHGKWFASEEDAKQFISARNNKKGE